MNSNEDKIDKFIRSYGKAKESALFYYLMGQGSEAFQSELKCLIKLYKELE